MGLAFAVRDTMDVKGGSSHARLTGEESCSQTREQQKLGCQRIDSCSFLFRDPLLPTPYSLTQLSSL